MGDALFCGDALFSAGCGRVFTGDYEAQYETLRKFKRLDDDINIYPGHEYTEINLRFAYDTRPNNKKVSKALEEVRELREKDSQHFRQRSAGRRKLTSFCKWKHWRSLSNCATPVMTSKEFQVGV